MITRPSFSTVIRCLEGQVFNQSWHLLAFQFSTGATTNSLILIQKLRW